MVNVTKLLDLEHRCPPTVVSRGLKFLSRVNILMRDMDFPSVRPSVTLSKCI